MRAPISNDDVTAGLVVIDKPSGWTSHDVVGRCRRLAGTRKVGHAGTLDPMATGVLVVGVGRATRLLGHLQLTDKEYRATIRLGQTTVTDDAEGDVLAEQSAGHLDRAAIEAAMVQFRGEIAQVPSAVSAIKVAGRRSYERVRSGESVDLPARPVTVSEFTITQLRMVEDASGLIDVDVQVACSSGTYVRALARDLGASLGVGGHLTMLRRTRVGPFTLDQAATLDALEQHWQVLDLDVATRLAFTACDLDDEQASDVRYGRALPGFDLGERSDRPVALFAPDGTFMALYEQRGTKAAPVAVFV